MQQIRLFFIALQFFTRIPIPSWVGFEPHWLHHASRYFPAVGWVVGIIAALVYALAALVWPQWIAVILSTIVSIYMTGAFHEDGFADVCDGFGGGMTPERVLDIMRDSRVGAYGAIGISLMLLFKCASLATMPANYVIVALLFGHPLSRLMSASVIWCLLYAKLEGKAKPLAQHMSTKEFLIACTCVVLPIAIIVYWMLPFVLPWQQIIFSLLLMLLSTWWMARLFVRRIGGYTGDCLGAVQQLSECLFYLGLASRL